MARQTGANGAGRYHSLLSNTLLIFVSTFGSKVLTFLLASLYTRVMPPEDYSAATLLIATCNLILPVMYLEVKESVIRFGLDDKRGRRDVISVGFFTVLAGFAVCLFLYPLFRQVGDVSAYLYLFYPYLICSAMRTVITHYVRSCGLVRLFAIDGIFTTVITLSCNLLFLLVFDWGVTGFVLATIVADGLSALCLFVIMQLHRHIHLRGINGDLVRSMFRYSLPLVPPAISWWVTNTADRYMIKDMCGVTDNALYTAASHLPSTITMVSAIFIQAWQISAFTGAQGKEGLRFFSNVFRSYYTFVFLAASGIILLAKPVTSVWLGERYADSWQYVPVLVLAVAFSCLVTFLGTVYNMVKKNTMVTVTTVVGAVLNILLNLWLIPRMGPQGAAVATLASFLVVFVLRAVDSRRYMPIRMQPMRIFMNCCLLLIQCRISLSQYPEGRPGLNFLLQCGVIFLLVFCNLGYIIFLLRRLLFMLHRRRGPASR